MARKNHKASDDFTPSIEVSKRDFSSLSIRDLLEARDAYHIHLAHLENVVGTAIGRFLIRRKDKNFTNPYEFSAHGNLPPRTLGNTDVRKWSWPCVLVFVKKWLSVAELHRHAEAVVPRFLYMPDGRVIPTCVVMTEPVEQVVAPLFDLSFPSHLVGGGYPVLTSVQGQQHVGSVGCLVTDGDSTYALTNQHVVGEPGREVFTLINGVRKRIGTSHANQAGKRPFGEIYPGWPGTRAFTNMDAGLINVEDVNTWTAQVMGMGELGPLIDLHVDTITLDIIGLPVRGFGGASGVLVGRIAGLFYRYRSVGGFDYIADMLIGPRNDDTPVNTRHGDSGTLWFYDPSHGRGTQRDPNEQGKRAPRYRPLALQWGGHKLRVPGGEADMQFALATFMSTICRILDIDPVSDHNIGQTPFWGRLGHYKIGNKACDLVVEPKLKSLMTKNLERIAFSDDAISDRTVFRKFKVGDFVPLADVPDLVWKRNMHQPNPAARGKENSLHFADMDEPGFGEFAGKTLFDISKNPKNIDVSVWNRYFDALQAANGPQVKRGALPFRVWQIYNEMVSFVSQAKVAEFVCAAGVLAHYLGDACQPLHASRLHDGPPGQSTGVHSKYEDAMLDSHLDELLVLINNRLKGKKAQADVSGGHDAAVKTVAMMRKVAGLLPPQHILDVFDAATPTSRLDDMWEALKTKTVAVMAEGCLRLASLWESAWQEGGGSQIAQAKLIAIPETTLRNIYKKPTFLESMGLKEMEKRQILQ